MATTTGNVPTWSASEKNLAEVVLAQAKKYSGSFLERHSRAAVAYGYENYAALPAGTKSFISALGGNKKGAPKRKMEAPRQKKEHFVTNQAMLSMWQEEIVTNASMQHGLHPEDEVNLIKNLGQQSS